jgi:outer membrane protein assembly factor BamB
MKKGLAIGIIFLFSFSALAQISIGYNTDISDSQISTNDYSKYLYPEFYNCYNAKEKPDYATNQVSIDSQDSINIKTVEINNPDKTIQSSDGPMDSTWSMVCHDLHHTSQSPYSTADNQGYEKWRFRSFDNGSIESSPVIDNNGTIYFGTMGDDCRLYAIYPNGTMKWKYQVGLMIWATPTIAEEGTIYVTSWDDYLYAINPNGTLKWRFNLGGDGISSPSIGEDGTIYCGSTNSKVYAINPNGTLKWTYSTGGWTRCPAIGDDGTIYIGSEDNYLYAFYPNGTVKWRFKAAGVIPGCPSIDIDGTVYIPSGGGYFYALYPANGTMKWKASTGGIVVGASVAISADDTLYVGTDKLRAYYPNNGSIIWSADIGGNLYGTCPAISADGTIYVSADHDGNGGDLVAVNPDGTIKWKEKISNKYARSSPCIGNDGTVYIGSTWENPYTYRWFGCLNAFNYMDPNAPTISEINGLNEGKTKIMYNYSFKSISPLDNDVYYYVDWGDGHYNDWSGPFNSNEQILISHAWNINGTFTIKARCKDSDNLWGPWGEFTVNIKPKIRVTDDVLFNGYLERFQILEKLINFIKI